MRTVLETNFSVEDVFDGLASYVKADTRNTRSKLLKKGIRDMKLFHLKERNTNTCLYYRETPLPWYVIFQCLVFA